MVGIDAAVVAEQLPAWSGGHLPAAVGEVIGDVAALDVVEQSRQVEVATHPDPVLIELRCTFAHRGAPAGVVFGGQPATRRAERGDVVEESVLGVGRQVHQQTFRTPHGGPGDVKTAVLQRGRPIVA